MNLSEIILFGGSLALVSFLGGALLAVPRRVRGSAVLMRNFVALGAGFMLAALFIEILPQVLNGWMNNVASSERGVEKMTMALSFVLGGYLVVHFCEHVLASHLQTGGLNPETHESLPETTVYAALAGLSVHTFFDGVTIATGFLVNFRFGLIVFIAVLLHKLPEGMMAASISTLR